MWGKKLKFVKLVGASGYESENERNLEVWSGFVKAEECME